MQLKIFWNAKSIRDDYYMNDGVKLTPLQIRPKQHKLNHVVGGVIVGNVKKNTNCDWRPGRFGKWPNATWSAKSLTL